MKRLSVAVMKGLVIGMLLALPTSANAAFEPPQLAGQIVGKVVNSCRPGDPSGIWVYILGRSFIAKTGTDGNFVLNYVPLGIHTIVLDFPPNPPQTIPNVTVQEPSSVVNLGTHTIGSCGPGQTQTICPAGTSMSSLGTCVIPPAQGCPRGSVMCFPGQNCAVGTCVNKPPPCPIGLSMCNGTCTNTGNDLRNCGSCGRLCDTGQTCRGGSCVPAQGCPAGSVMCFPGQNCAVGTCVLPTAQGICPAGSVMCSGACVNPGADVRNCGACGIVCQGQQQCVTGRCQ